MTAVVGGTRDGTTGWVPAPAFVAR